MKEHPKLPWDHCSDQPHKIKDRKLVRYQEYLFGEVRATVVAKRVDP